MQNCLRLLTLMAVSCLAAGIASGCLFERGGTEVVGPGPAAGRDDSSTDASLMVTDAPSAHDAPGAADLARAEAPATAGMPGAACADPSACISGFCVDGVCCQSACPGPCEACDQRGQLGTCAPVAASVPPGHGGCLGAGSVCAGSCDGASEACKYPAADVECAPASCSDGMAQARSVCSGAGACVPGAMLSCAPFSCDGAICAGGCGSGRPCQMGNYCSGGRCFTLLDNGGSCATADQCASGACVDGHCCQVPSCGVCSACVGTAGTCQPVTSAPDPDTCTGNDTCGADGQCRKINGQACAGAESCVSGFCTGGICCDGACTGPCQTCALPGSVGTCQPAPLASDAKNCGRCGNACSTNHIAPVCRQGTCTGSCASGFADCNGDLVGDGCEINLGTDPKNCGACATVCPGTRCAAGVCEKIQFAWSAAGPIANQTCVPITESADPNGWNDNYLCTQRDFGFQWSSAGVIAGMTCTQWLEPGDPFTWADNYLCAPVDYGLRWSSAGAITGLRCTQILEPADPSTWNDNYLCAPP